MNGIKIVAVVCLSVVIMSCQTLNPDQVSMDLSQAQLFQHGQDRVMAQDYDQAAVYFKLGMERFADDEMYVGECEYNLILTMVRSGKYVEANEALKVYRAKIAESYRLARSPFADLAEKLQSQVDAKLPKVEAKAETEATPTSEPTAVK